MKRGLPWRGDLEPLCISCLTLQISENMVSYQMIFFSMENQHKFYNLLSHPPHSHIQIHRQRMYWINQLDHALQELEDIISHME